MKSGARGHLRLNRANYLVAGFCLVAVKGLFPTPAQAANVTIIVKTSERVEFDDNISRSVDNNGGNVFSSVSNVSANFDWRMPRLELSASTGTSFRKSVGKGKSDNLNSFDPNLSLGLVKRGKTSLLSLSSDFKVQNSTFSELEDTDITNQDTDRISFNLNSGWTYNVNSTNSLTLSSGVSIVEFTKSSDQLSPFINLSTQAQWAHNLTNLTSLSGTLGWSLFKSDNLASTQSTTFSASTGLSTRLSPRLSVNVGGGLSLITTERDQIVLGVNLGRSTNTRLGFQADLGVNYKLRRTQYNLAALQSLEPSAEGQVNIRSSLAFNITHSVNQRSSINMATTISRREAAGSSAGQISDQFSASAAYSYKLNRNWDAAIGYDFNYRENDAGTAQSNKVFVSLSRNTVLDP